MATNTQVSVSTPQKTDTLMSSTALRQSLQAESEQDSEVLQPKPENTQDLQRSNFREDFSRVPVRGVSKSLVQPKLVVGQTNDKYEQEADRVASQVMQMSEPAASPSQRATPYIQHYKPKLNQPLQRQLAESEMMPEEDEEEKTVQTKALSSQPLVQHYFVGSLTQLQRQSSESEEEKEEEETIQTKSTATGTKTVAPSLETQLGNSRSGGSPLPKSTRTFMESRFSHDFSSVRIHSNSQSAQMNRGLHAQAFTHGNHVYFGQGQYQPHTRSGQRLLAHELTHVVQQMGGRKLQPKSLRQPNTLLHGSETYATTIGKSQNPSENEALSTATDSLVNNSLSASSGDTTSTTGGETDGLQARLIFPTATPNQSHQTAISLSSGPDLQLEPATETLSEQALSGPRFQSGGVSIGRVQQPSLIQPRLIISPTFNTLQAQEEGLFDSALSTLGSGVEAVADFAGINISDYLDDIPGYSLFTVIIGYDPVRRQQVDRNATNLIRGLMGLVPFGTRIFDALANHEILQSAFQWINDELERLDLSRERLQRMIDGFVASIGIDDIPFVVSLARDYFAPLVSDVESFANSLVDQLIEMIKEVAVGLAEEYLEENPAWELIKKVIHYDPLRDEAVDAPTVEILEDFLMLIGKQTELEQMRERGTLQETADWLDTQIGSFQDLLGQFSRLIEGAWEAIQPENLPNLASNLQTLANQIFGFLQGVGEFALTIALKVLELIKNALLSLLKEHANSIPGYHLLTVMLERDPFTQEEVPLTPTNLIRGFMSLISGGEEQFQQMQETGVIPEAAQRIETAMSELGITWPFVQELFLNIWNSFTIDDLVSPIDAAIRVLSEFEEPLGRLFTFVIEVIKVMLELILVLMNFPTDLIGNIITNALQALDDIQRDPVGFLINLLETAKLGFQKFFDNILDHLIGGLTDWLFRTVRDAGIEPPADFSFESILGFVLDVLGLTMDHMWELLAEHIGQERVDQIRGTIDRIVEIAGEAWAFIEDVQERGIVAVWEYIESQLTNLWDIVLEQVQDYVMERVVVVGMRWLLSLLDATGITPVINSFIAFFNAIQSAIEYLRDMLEIVNDFVSTVASIAAGELEPGAARMEEGLGNSIPIIIGFIANQLGLGNISERLGEIIESIRSVVDRALNWLIEQALRLGGAILESLGFGSESQEDDVPQTGDPEHDAQVQAGLNAIDEKENRVVENGHITREAAEQIVTEVLNEHSVFRTLEVVDGGTRWNYHYVASPDTVKTGEEKADEQANFPPISMPSFSNGIKAPRLTKAEYLRVADLPSGENSSQHRGTLIGWNRIQVAGLSRNAAWVKMHLLTERLGGRATDSNLTPARGPETNLRFRDSVEHPAYNYITNNSNEMIWYETRIDYHGAPDDAYISSISMRWGGYEYVNDRWQEVSTPRGSDSQSTNPPDFSAQPERVRINEAGRTRISALLGGDESLARIIVDERRENGQYNSYVHLMLRIRRRVQRIETENLMPRLSRLQNAISEDTATFERI